MISGKWQEVTDYTKSPGPTKTGLLGGQEVGSQGSDCWFLGFICQHETDLGRSRRQAKGIPTRLPPCAGTPNPYLAVNRSWFSNCIQELVVAARVHYTSTWETGEQEQREFEVNLGFMVSSRLAWTSRGKTMSQKTNK